MEVYNKYQFKNIKEEVKWLVDDLWNISTVKFHTPNYNYDYTKVYIGLEELAQYIIDKASSKHFEIAHKIKIRDNLLDKIMQASIFFTTNEDTEKLTAIIDGVLNSML